MKGKFSNRAKKLMADPEKARLLVDYIISRELRSKIKLEVNPDNANITALEPIPVHKHF